MESKKIMKLASARAPEHRTRKREPFGLNTIERTEIQIKVIITIVNK
jgi:hypothetical protein